MLIAFEIHFPFPFIPFEALVEHLVNLFFSELKLPVCSKVNIGAATLKHTAIFSLRIFLPVDFKD